MDNLVLDLWFLSPKNREIRRGWLRLLEVVVPVVAVAGILTQVMLSFLWCYFCLSSGSRLETLVKLERFFGQQMVVCWMFGVGILLIKGLAEHFRKDFTLKIPEPVQCIIILFTAVSTMSAFVLGRVDDGKPYEWINSKPSIREEGLKLLTSTQFEKLLRANLRHEIAACVFCIGLGVAGLTGKNDKLG